MQNLGSTRNGSAPDHLLLTPETFVRAPLPGMQRATAIVHVAPANGAAFTAYTVEFEPGGTMETGPAQLFLYVLEGKVMGQTAGQYSYLPPASKTRLIADTSARAFVIEKIYSPLNSHPPSGISGDEGTIAGQALEPGSDIQVRRMLPDDPAFDFAVNTMTYPPGAALPMVESHVMEHGLLMLEGGGIYRLGDRWYPTKAGDFIWMAPFCAQWFGALGKTPAKYLIYKDWNRHPLSPR